MTKPYYTHDELERAKNVNLLDYLRQNGYDLIKKGKDYCLREHDSLIISENGLWHWKSRNIGGNAIEFLKQYEGHDFINAVKILAGSDNLTCYKAICNYETSKGEFALPEREDNHRRVFSYLYNSRKIDPKIISQLMHERKLYESKDTHNCVFVGFDKEGTARYAGLRGTVTYTKFRGDVSESDKEYSFLMNGMSRTVYVFESPIDAMSHASMSKINGEDWTYDYRISLGCVSDKALERFLLDYPHIEKLVFCLDNDKTGNTMAELLKNKYEARGYNVEIDPPVMKDYNEDLGVMVREMDLADMEC